MLKNRKIQVINKILFVCYALLLSGLSSAANIAFSGTTAAQLQTAINNAGAGGSVTLTRNLTLDRTVVINVPNFTLWGTGKTLTESGSINMIVVNQPGARISNVRFIGQTTGGFRAFITPNSTNLTVQNSYFENGSGGIRSIGEPPRGLTVRNNTFQRVPTAIAFNRDVVRVNGANQVARALNGGFIQIIGNTIRNSSISAITIDAGNDGGSNTSGNIAGQGDPRFPSYGSPLRAQINGRVTDFFSGQNRRSVISGNVISGAGGFGIALARVNGFNILGNTIHMANTGKAFRRAIHLENRTNGVTVANNVINLSGGTGSPSAIGMTNFTDYGTAANFANGPRRINILNNTIAGFGRGIVGSGFAAVNISNNNLTGVNGARYSFFNAPGGANQIQTANGNLPSNP